MIHAFSRLAMQILTLGVLASTASYADTYLEFPVARSTMHVTSSTYSFKEVKEIQVILKQNAMVDNTFSLELNYTTGGIAKYKKVFSSKVTTNKMGVKTYEFESRSPKKNPVVGATLDLDPNMRIMPEKTYATLTDYSHCRCRKLHQAPWSLSVSHIMGARTPSHLNAVGTPDAFVRTPRH